MPIPDPSPDARAVVTGASHGIGAALAEELAARGHSLVIVARRADLLDELARGITEKTGVIVEVRPVDLTETGARECLCSELSERRVSILCDNAGTGMMGPIADHDLISERALVQLNTVAVHDVALAVLPGMLARRAGGILVSGSAAGNLPIPNLATYAATKAFDNAFAESLHGELRGTGVHVTLLAPGAVRTLEPDQLGLPLVGRKVFESSLVLDRHYTARKSLDALERNKMRVVPGVASKAMSVAGRYTPAALASPIAGAVYKRLSRYPFAGA